MVDSSHRAPSGSSPAHIVLVEHDPNWSANFAREAATLHDAVGALLRGLHHIGSTAVPGIVAKPVIDMLGVVRSVEKLDTHSHHLEAGGYEALGEFGIPGRRYFRKNTTNGLRTHQLHAFAEGSEEIQRHLNFRDYLRAHPGEARAYAELKQTLVRAAGGDMALYTDGKTHFIRNIERHAALWRAER